MIQTRLRSSQEAKEGAEAAMEGVEQVARGDELGAKAAVEAGERESRPLTSTSIKQSRSSRSSDGDKRGREEDEDEVPGDTVEASIEPLLEPLKLELRTRRVNASPANFNKGHVESLTMQHADERPTEKRRPESNVEIGYDSTKTPQLSALPRTSNDAKIHAGIEASRATVTTVGLRNAPTAASTPLLKKKASNLIDAICRDSAILIHFVFFLPLPSVISLYAISKPFHYVFNRHLESGKKMWFLMDLPLNSQRIVLV